MLQESTSTWNLRNMPYESSATDKVYLIFLLAVCVVTSVRLVRVWRAVPPLKAHHKLGDVEYVQLLQLSAASLKRWIGFTLLIGGIFASIKLTHDSNMALNSNALSGGFLVFIFLRELSPTLTMSLLVALYAFLAHWYISRRVENLRRS